WVAEDVLKRVTDNGPIGALLDQFPRCENCRPELAMAIRLMSTLAYARKLALPDTTCRRALETLLFYHRRLLPALEKLPCVLRELAEKVGGARRQEMADTSPDLSADVRTIETTGETGREIARELRELLDFASPQPALDTPLVDLSYDHRFLFNS